jgi:hypothetical protein
MNRVFALAAAAVLFVSSTSDAHAFGLLNRLWGGNGCCAPACEPACCAPEPTCCAPEPTCCAPEPTCCAPEPACGCEPTCCDSCHRRCGLLDGLFGWLRSCRHNHCCAPACEPSCGCAPSCGY